VALIFQKKIIIQLNCKNAVSRAFREKLYSYRSKRPQLLITKTTLHNRHRLSDGVVDRALVGAFPSRRRVSLSLAQSAANKFTDLEAGNDVSISPDFERTRLILVTK